ncbi:MAG: extracellular solute-binding protein [Burkholderiales bacterium]|nr:extracellular solute-binding protein [Burkholderiales bacterium]
MTQPILLRGITWGHTRGFVPMVATAQRYRELHPEMQISWQTRSLQDFADQSVAALARDFDLLVIDHPSIGEAAAAGLFLPLDEFVPEDFLDDQATHSVGASHRSYHMLGQQWALAIDAASPVSAARLDLRERHDCDIPATWAELIALARRGLVAFAGLPLDCLMHWYGLCLNEGEAPFREPGRIVGREAGLAALDALAELVAACGPECLERNPIAAYELLTSGDAFLYSPFAYGYSNYARRSTVAQPLHFGGLVSRRGKALVSTLGGAGLAVSAQCKSVPQAVDYARFVAGAEVQRGLYTASGGQPGHRSAWTDAENNRISQDFFANTLPTLDAAFVRPRYPGYIEFQERAPQVMGRFLRHEDSAVATLAALDDLDRRHRRGVVDETVCFAPKGLA